MVLLWRPHCFQFLVQAVYDFHPRDCFLGYRRLLEGKTSETSETSETSHLIYLYKKGVSPSETPRSSQTSQFLKWHQGTNNNDCLSFIFRTDFFIKRQRCWVLNRLLYFSPTDVNLLPSELRVESLKVFLFVPESLSTSSARKKIKKSIKASHLIIQSGFGRSCHYSFCIRLYHPCVEWEWYSTSGNGLLRRRERSRTVPTLFLPAVVITNNIAVNGKPAPWRKDA